MLLLTVLASAPSFADDSWTTTSCPTVNELNERYHRFTAITADRHIWIEPDMNRYYGFYNNTPNTFVGVRAAIGSDLVRCYYGNTNDDLTLDRNLLDLKIGDNHRADNLQSVSGEWDGQWFPGTPIKECLSNNPDQCQFKYQ
nr:DUF3757 domain-containing protein [Vibrio coralliilyticus]